MAAIICEYGSQYWLCPASAWRRFEGHYVDGYPCKYAKTGFSNDSTVYCGYEYKDIDNDINSVSRACKGTLNKD